MSQLTSRTIRYSALIWMSLIISALIPLYLLAAEPHIAATASAEPAPWWQQVEDFQALALKWIAALTVILGAIATLAAFLIAKVQDIKQRLDRHETRIAANIITRSPASEDK